MSVLLSASNNGVLGIHPRTLILKCRNASGGAIAQYDVVRLDLSQASLEPGQGSAAVGSASNSIFANVVKGPTTKGSATTGIYGVAQEAIADGAAGHIMFVGTTLVTATSKTYAVGNQVGFSASAITAGAITNDTVTQPIGVCHTAGTVTQIRMTIDGNLSFGT
jgi:hypothetical protein